MQIRINTDSNIKNSEGLAQQVRTTVVSALERFGDRITRVEAHLSDENSDKFGTDDKQTLSTGGAPRWSPTYGGESSSGNATVGD